MTRNRGEGLVGEEEGATTDGVPAAGYRLLEHTAEIALEAWGATPERAFSEAAFGMYAIMLGNDPRTEPEADTAYVADIRVTGDDWDQLLVNWLAELLFKFEVEAFVLVDILTTECAPPTCSARLRGHVHVPLEGPSGLPIKAVTYHQLRVNVTHDRTEIRVIFDV